MGLFKCPVCKTGDAEEVGYIVSRCNVCKTKFERDGEGLFVLEKLGSREYEAQYEDLKAKFGANTGYSEDQWNNIANGLPPGERPKEMSVEEERELQKEREEEEERKREEFRRRVQQLTVSTTPTLQGFTIEEYKGVVTSHVTVGVNMFKDLFAGVRNVVGGRSSSLQKTMAKMRETGLEEIKTEAYRRKANAVVGITMDFDEYSEGMLMLNITGTAVVTKPQSS